MKILVVDDEIVMVDFLSEALREKGFEVDSACDARSAIEKLGVNGFDLVITGIVMPGINGIELLRMAKKRYAGLKVIVWSGSGDERTVSEAIKLGAEAYHMKSGGFGELLASVEELAGFIRNNPAKSIDQSDPDSDERTAPGSSWKQALEWLKSRRPDFQEAKVAKVLLYASFAVVALSVDKIGWPLSTVLCLLLVVVGSLIELKNKKRSSSYRLELIIEPHWYDIFARLLPGLQIDDEIAILSFLNEIHDQRTDMQLVTHKFVIFEHSNGLCSIWHDNNKSFVQREELLLRLFVFWQAEPEASKVLDEFAAKNKQFRELLSRPHMKQAFLKLLCEHGISKKGDLFRVQPELGELRAHFAVNGPVRDRADGQRLSSIPLYNAVIPFLAELDQHTSRGAMKGIKRFPEDLRIKFAQRGVTYCSKIRFHNIEYSSVSDFYDHLTKYVDQKWARKRGVEIYSSELSHHWFSTEFFSLGVHIEFFQEPDR